MRIAMGVEYNGLYYHGWQSQSGLITVQDCVERALSKLADHPIRVHCAGRTDVGVHATGQVIHFDTDAERSHSAWVLGANTYLDAHIRVRWVKQMPEDFHARFKATRRHYRYVIYNNPVASGIFNGAVTWVHTPLCESAMAEAGQFLLGEHDFSAFRGSQCQARHPVRNLTHFAIERQGPLLFIDVEANGFLHHMVRNIAGVLIRIGKNKQPPGWTKEVLESRDRRLADVTAPPHGLYLIKVTYPEEYQGDLSISPFYC